jgi:hypothetical protein
VSDTKPKRGFEFVSILETLFSSIFKMKSRLIVETVSIDKNHCLVSILIEFMHILSALLFLIRSKSGFFIILRPVHSLLSTTLGRKLERLLYLL